MDDLVCFHMIVFNGEPFVELAIKSILPFGKVVVTEGPTEYYQKLGYTTSTDNTNEILRDLVGEENVVHGQFREKDEMMWASEHLIPKRTPFVFMVDSDEFYTREDLDKIFELLESNRYDSMAFTADSFFGSFDHIVMGWERAFEVHRIMRWKENPHWVTHRPPTVNAPDGSPWRNHRHLSHKETEKLGITLKHYSYVYLSQVKAKAGYYDNYDPTLCIPNYFNDVFARWVLGDSAERFAIEDKWKGVHNFKPERRKSTYTQLFTGKHPEEIESRLPKLRARFEEELNELKV